MINLRGIAHTLHSSSGDNGAVTKFNTLRCKYDRFQATSADLVDGGGIGASGETSSKANLTRWGLTDARLDDISEVNLLNKCGINFSGLESMLKSECAELRGGEGLEGAVEGANRGAGRGNDDDFVRLDERLAAGRWTTTRRLTIARARDGVAMREEEDANLDRSMMCFYMTLQIIDLI